MLQKMIELKFAISEYQIADQDSSVSYSRYAQRALLELARATCSIIDDRFH